MRHGCVFTVAGGPVVPVRFRATVSPVPGVALQGRAGDVTARPVLAVRTMPANEPTPDDGQEGSGSDTDNQTLTFDYGTWGAGVEQSEVELSIMGALYDADGETVPHVGLHIEQGIMSAYVEMDREEAEVFINSMYDAIAEAEEIVEESEG